MVTDAAEYKLVAKKRRCLSLSVNDKMTIDSGCSDQSLTACVIKEKIDSEGRKEVNSEVNVDAVS